MPDLGLLNNSVISTWGNRVEILRGNMRFPIDGVLIEGYRDQPAGNEDVEQADPFFSFRATDYARTGATQGDMVVMGDTHYSIVADPEMDGGDWCRVAVRVYA